MSASPAKFFVPVGECYTAAMDAPRDHHFIPAFYLKRWVDGSGKLVEYSRKGGKVIPKPVGPRSTGFERDLYAFPELPAATAQYMEQIFFAYADQKASDALDLHLGVFTKRWTPELLSAWARFVIGVHWTTPAPARIMTEYGTIE